MLFLVRSIKIIPTAIRRYTSISTRCTIFNPVFFHNFFLYKKALEIIEFRHFSRALSWTLSLSRFPETRKIRDPCRAAFRRLARIRPVNRSPIAVSALPISARYRDRCLRYLAGSLVYQPTPEFFTTFFLSLAHSLLFSPPFPSSETTKTLWELAPVNPFLLADFMARRRCINALELGDRPHMANEFSSFGSRTDSQVS